MDSVHATLTATVVATQTIATSNADEVIVHFVSGTGPIYFTVDGSTPSVGGDDTYIVHSNVPARAVRIDTADSVTVKLISATNDGYSVEVI